MDLSTCLIANVPPLQLPIQNINLASDAYVSAKGIGITIGNPPQIFALKPAFDANNTWVTLAGYCEGTQNYSCIATQHGVYNPPPNVNKTFTMTAWNGSETEDTETQNTFYNDDADIAGHTIYDMPFFSYYYGAGGFTNPAALGLGSDSSFINATSDIGIIPNKQWSIWPGNTRQALDGLLIFGGYDKARAAGNLQRYPFYYRNPRVQVTGLTWESNGVSTSLMPNDTQSMTMSLEPYFTTSTLYADSLYTLLNLTGSVLGEDGYYVYPYSVPPVGDLIVTLSDGQSTTIPSDDLFQIPTKYNEQGILQTSNSTVQRLMITTAKTGSPQRLGLPFMTQKLFVSDFERGAFYMADAVKSDLGTSAQDLQPLCTGGPTPTSSGTPGPTSPVTVTPPAPSKTNVAAIAGGVGGGIGGLLLIGLIAFFLLRRRKKKAQDADHNPPEISQPDHHGTPPPKYPNSYDTAPSSELGGGTSQPLYASRSTTPGLGVQMGIGQGYAGAKDGPVTGVQAVPQSQRYELESDGPLVATSGPMDLPANYDQRWHDTK